MTWQMMDKVPRQTPVKFKRADGTEFIGKWAPFWCGDDCPCGVDIEDDEPICWCAFEEGQTTGEPVDPIMWQHK